jgi:hypothetical protein
MAYGEDWGVVAVIVVTKIILWVGAGIPCMESLGCLGWAMEEFGAP